MPKKSPPSTDELLSRLPAPRSRAEILKHPVLLDRLRDYLRLKAEGDERAHASTKHYYEKVLLPAFGGPSFDAARRYVQGTLLIDISTGKPHGEQEEE